MTAQMDRMEADMNGVSREYSLVTAPSSDAICVPDADRLGIEWARNPADDQNHACVTLSAV